MCINLTLMRNFVSAGQLAFIRQAAKGEEGSFFRDKLAEIYAAIRALPWTYQDEKEGNAVARLHYFLGQSHWYITERDNSAEQHQAYGLASVNGECPELGYISIADLIKYGAELDLHFRPTTLDDLQLALTC